MKNIIALLVSILFITACSLKDEPITDKDGTISVTKPALWFNIDGLNPVAIINIGNPVSEAYFIVISEPITDFPDNYTLKQYSDLTRDLIKQGSINFSEIYDESLTTVNGMPAIKYTIDTTVENIRLRYWHISVNSNKNFYQLVVWSLLSKFNDNKERFQTVIESFREKKKTDHSKKSGTRG